MSFLLAGSQIPALQLKGWFNSKMSIQEYRNEIQKLILNLCMNYMVHADSLPLLTWKFYVLKHNLVTGMYDSVKGKVVMRSFFEG